MQNSKNRYVNTHFWDDDYIDNLDPIEKLLFIYLLTNSKTRICGIYELKLRLIALDTGIDSDMILKILKRFEEDGKAKYEKPWIAIKNFIKHQKLNPNIEKGIKICLEQAPESLRKWVQA